jgi:steroid delta-isomerase-like uncharacterized protein
MTSTPIRQAAAGLALATLVACGSAQPSTRSTAMTDQTSDQNKRNVEKLFDDGFNRGDLALVDQLVAPEYIDPTGATGPAAFRAVAAGLRNAFPDIHYTLDDVIAEGDRVAVRWHWTGTHKGQFRAFAATGKAMKNTGTGIFRFKEGKIVAADLETDRLGFLQQVGAVPDFGPGGRPAPAAHQ